jgi:hypothetical protein
MWKCISCPQISTRRWNLTTHIKRKHKGIGNPIALEYHHGRGVSKISALEDSFSHDYDQRNPNRISAGSNPNISVGNNNYPLREESSLIDDFHDIVIKKVPEQIRKLNEVAIFFGSGQTRQEIPNRNIVLTRTPSPSTDTQSSALTPIIFGFEALVCEKCMTVIPLPVSIVDGIGKEGVSLIKTVHVCELERLKLVTESNNKVTLDDLYAEIPNVLSRVCRRWTNNKVRLVSIKLSRQTKEPIKISAACGKGENYWAIRAVQGVCDVLSYEELLEFLEIAEGRTFNIFKVSTGDKVNTSDVYLFYISWLPMRPVKIETLINNYFFNEYLKGLGRQVKKLPLIFYSL